MHLDFHLSQPQFHFAFALNKDQLGVKPLYWNLFLIRLAQSFSTIFIPIYLVQIGLSIFGQGALISALAFMFTLYLLSRLTTLITIFPATWAARSFGFRWVILFANVLRAAVFGLLALAPENLWLLVPTMVFSGMMIALFWPSFHTIFTQDGTIDHFGKEVGWRTIFEKIAGVIGPAIGGVIITLLGFPVLFALGVIIVLLSSVPIFFMKHHRHTDKVSIKELFAWLSEKRFQRASLSFAGMYAHDTTIVVIWPVFVFLLLINYEKVGIVFSVVTLISVISAWIAGKLFDTSSSHQKRLFKIGSLATAVIWLVRGSLRTFGQVLLVDSIDKLVSVFYYLPYNAYSYERARGSQAFSFMVYRELLISAAAIIFWLLAIGLLTFSWFWYGLFGLAAIGVLSSQFILESKE